MLIMFNNYFMMGEAFFMKYQFPEYLYTNLSYLRYCLILIMLSGSFIESKSQAVFSEVPYYTFGDDLKLMPKDSAAMLQFRFRLQNRLSYLGGNIYDVHESQLRARVERMRIRFDGFFYDPDFIYVIQLGFAPTDLQETGFEEPRILRDLLFIYRFSNQFSLGLGQTRLPANRQRVISSGDLQFVDRAFLNEVFIIDFGFGLHSYYYNNIGNFFFGYRGSLASEETQFLFQENQWGLNIHNRIELLPLGTFKDQGDYFESDLEREETPKLSIGLSHGLKYNSRFTSRHGGTTLFQPVNMNTFMADLIFKYQGISVSADLIQRTTPTPFTEEEGEVRYAYVGRGINFQGGYLFENDIEVAFRYSELTPFSPLEFIEDNIQHFTIGFNKFIRGHRLKILSDFTYQVNNRNFDGLNINNFLFRLQFEMGI